MLEMTKLKKNTQTLSLCTILHKVKLKITETERKTF